MSFRDGNFHLEESQRLEFKEAAGGLPEDLWETYSAFANTEGGKLSLAYMKIERRTRLLWWAFLMPGRSSTRFGVRSETQRPWDAMSCSQTALRLSQEAE